METTNVKLLNKLRQKYLNNLQIGEKDGTGGFIFSGDDYCADHSEYGLCTFSREKKLFSKKELIKLCDLKDKYIEQNGVDDKFLNDLASEYEADLFPASFIDWVADDMCKLKKPEYIIKFLDFKYVEYALTTLKKAIIETQDAEYIKLFIEKIKPHKYKKSYKELKKAYKEIVKSNKAGV